MKIADRIVGLIAARLISGCLTLAVLVSSSAFGLPGPQDPIPVQERQEAASANQADATTQMPTAGAAGVEPLPDSPGAGKYQTVIAQAGVQPGAPQPSQPPQPPPAQAQKPVGTAAAETTTTTGFAVSRPAGAALAPAKQKRSRTILISVAAVVGAALAVGTVAALSKGTPSKPPGAQ
jgi:hypothetical protein